MISVLEEKRRRIREDRENVDGGGDLALEAAKAIGTRKTARLKDKPETGKERKGKKDKIPFINQILGAPDYEQNEDVDIIRRAVSGQPALARKAVGKKK